MRISASAAAAGATVVAAAAILTACSASDVMRPEVDVILTAALVAPAPGLQALVPSNPYLYEDQPEREAAPEPMVMPESEVQCRRELRSLGASFADLPTIDDGGGCGIPWPIKLTGVSGGIDVKPAATLNCQMALAVARWSKDELNPSARLRYLTSVKTIHQGSSYSCRRIRGSRTMSEHSKGNALDIMRIELRSGKEIGVRKPGFFSFREKGLLNNVRADACGYFSTVLGPGYDRDHKDHFHFDLASRRNGRVACR